MLNLLNFFFNYKLIFSSTCPIRAILICLRYRPLTYLRLIFVKCTSMLMRNEFTYYQRKKVEVIEIKQRTSPFFLILKILHT